MAHRMAKESETGRYMSIDICREIVVCLPVGTVLRFRSVCKQWRGIIDEPQFKQAHLKHALEHKMQTKTLIVFMHRYESIKVEDVPIHAAVLDELERPLRHLWSAPPADTTRMIGTCNGLICFHDNGRQVIRLDNMVTGESLSLPMAPQSAEAAITDKHNMYCFGFHPMTQQYKIIHFPIDIVFYRFDAVQVYTIGDKSWREVRTPNASYEIYGGVVSINGAIYWLSKWYNYKQIIWFDLKTEHITSINFPSLQSILSSVSLMEVNARLCLAVRGSISDNEYRHAGEHIMIRRLENRRGGIWNCNSKQHIEIWCLEDGGAQIWSLKYRVQLQMFDHWTPQYFIHRKHLVTSTYFDKLYAHKLRENDLVKIDRESEMKLINSVGMLGQTFPYFDSFAPLKIYSS